MDYLPDVSDGYLPLFVLLVGVTAITNALQSYRDISYLRRVYAPPVKNSKSIKITRTVEEDENTPLEFRRPSVTASAVAFQPESPVTELAARLFGTWNISVGVVRCIAAYHMNEKSWYAMSAITNVIGLVHFGLEAFVYETARPVGPWLAPTVTASIGLTWHLFGWGSYFA